MEALMESDAEDVQQEVKQEEELEAMSEAPVSAAQDLMLSLDHPDRSLPQSYRMNSPDELQLLSIAESFQRQFSCLYPDRKPLMLCPVNECGIKKFVSTSIRPTETGRPELFTWQGCASFVANFLTLQPLESPTELPRSLFSSSWVLQSQRASCFEFSSLLVSLLCGVNYDAYCVSGYAIREMCLLDQRLQRCPLLDTEVTTVASEQEPELNKYDVKPQKELKSHFVMQQEKKKQEEEAAMIQKQRLQEEGGWRPPDPLWGLRIHCWVLVLSGSRSIQENFFIDPLTGKSYSTDDQSFLGIESVWDNFNYYVNMQDCKNGCKDMVYHLDDLKLWEPLLFGATNRKQLVISILKRKDCLKRGKISVNKTVDERPRVFEMPRSWISYIHITKKDLELCFPDGQKETRYRKAKLEEFSPNLRKDGLVTRLTQYKDLDCSEVVLVKEWYRNRDDHLEERQMNVTDGVTTERFRHRRRFHLLFHRFSPSTSEHDMEFSSVRVDNLVRRVDSPGEMTETYKGRDDFLYYRHVVFDRHVQFTEPADKDADPDDRPVQKVVECFHRNRSKPASEDVAERVFLLAQRRIEVTYHLDDNEFIPSKRSFIKPRESTEQQRAGDFTHDMVSSFQVDLSQKPLNLMSLHKMLVSLMKDEEKVSVEIRDSKKEVRDIMSCREYEDRHVQLHFSPWTTTGAAQAGRLRQEMEAQALEEQQWLQQKEKDVLAPLLIRLSSLNTQTLSADKARQLHQHCLSEFKQRMVEQAQLIQERHEKETQELQDKQRWYQENQLNLKEQEEEEYQAYCSEKTLRIHVTKKRLSMHKESASQKYGALDQKLKRDPRLAPHLLS